MSLRIQVNPNDEVAVDEVGGGGGNPNYVETITGTIANPFGTNEKFQEILNGLIENTLTVKLEFIVGFIEQYQMTGVLVSNTSFFFACYLPPTFSSGHAIRLLYSNNLQLNKYYITVAKDGTWVEGSLSADLATTLTIIHHPLPES